MSGFKYIELFAGIGGFRMALDRLGGECVFASEIDKFARQSYKAIYGEEPSGDITEIDAKDIPDHDVLTAGFPCFTAGHRIVTDKGLVNIEDIRKGDRVLTHKGRYQKVVVPMRKLFSGDLYEITAKYYRIPIKVTPEHPFWTKRGWVKAEDLREGDYVGMPLNKRSELPEQFTYTKKLNQNKETTKKSELPFDNPHFWNFIGYWLAEGWTVDRRNRKQGIRNAYRIVLAANEEKLSYISNVLNELNINYTVTKEKTCYKVHIIDMEYWLFVKEFTKGSKASDKRLPEFVHSLPRYLASALIDGYRNGDGCSSKGYTQYTSISLPLLEGIQRLLLKTEKRLYSLMRASSAGVTYIEGRKVNVKECYQLRGGSAQGGCVEFTDDYVYYKLDRIRKERVTDVLVYNFEVDVDNSYCLPMIAVHNCQSFSVAGKRKGFEDTRGTLFFEIARIAAEKKPRLMLLENVKGLVSHDKGRTLDIMIQTLHDIGYAVDFRVLNSKYFGVPQNRERIFIVCSRDATYEPWDITEKGVVGKAKKRIQALGVRTFNFDWPEESDVTKRLRDILESNVDVKYYLSGEKTYKLLEELDVPPALQRKAHGGELKEVEPGIVGHVDIRGHDSIKRVYEVEGISPTLTTMQGGHREPKIAEPCAPLENRPVLAPERIEKRQNGRRFKEDGEESFTLTAQDRHGVAVGVYPKYHIRKLTPLECWRLQGFPDWAHEAAKQAGVSDSQRYKQSGNAVTVNTIEALGECLIRFIGEIDRKGGDNI